MAKRGGVMYIQYHIEGTAARQPEVRPLRKKAQPQAPRKPQVVLQVQPLALLGILVAAVMLLSMAVGSVKLWKAQQEKQAMAEYVAHLEWANGLLEAEYESSLDLERIERDALALGMVPQEQVPHMSISLPETPTEEPQGFWEKIIGFFQ